MARNRSPHACGSLLYDSVGTVRLYESTRVVEEKTNKEIAAALNLSDKTVKNYLSNAFHKLKASPIRRRKDGA